MPDQSAFPQVQLGGPDGPMVSAIGFGAMSISSTIYGAVDEEHALDTLTRAADLGTTFWDTSDAYGASQETIGKWFAKTGRRKEIFLATKWGSVDTTYTFDNPKFYTVNSMPSYIRSKVEESLKACQTDHIDLYYQHRVDQRVPVEVVMETLRPYVESGAIKWIGFSEASIDVLKRAKSVPGIGNKVIAVQMEYSPFELEIETSGFAEAAKQLGISIVAYSPLGRGVMTGQYRSRADFQESDVRQILPRFSDENFPANLAIVDRFKTIGEKYNATSGQLTLAWMLARHPTWVPIPGTRSVKRLEENARAADIKISEEDLKLLNEVVDAADVKGDRFPPEFAHMFIRDCIPLSEWHGEESL
ncbi:hypothetical protein EIP91_008414 [Steccherinum ochraceum]|uniref:NADP-dependent oxidoreductase domain-containing protein n=1 Tax=Steccherinum ochraceum TaxID=92696 RepID=A0A4V2MV85_9APHY|nr:hypothetical protein EIP91_008414 [Steccherinum ochraceum]